MKRARAPARGFTLIEVLVALAIVVAGVGALLSTLSSAAETTAYLRDKTFAQWVALNQLEIVRLAQVAPANGKTTGDVDYAGRKWHYEQEIQDAQIPSVRRVDVRVVLVQEGKTPDGKSWTTSVTGILGSALGSAPAVLQPDWDSGNFQGRPLPPTKPGGSTPVTGTGTVTGGGTGGGTGGS